MRHQIKGSVIVVTGASSGIGRATALLLAKRGAQVVITARRGDVLDDLQRKIEARGGHCLAVTADVTDPAEVHGVARAAVDHFGHLDAWVNNAGVYLSGPLEEIPLPVFERVLQTNLMGYVHGTRACLPYFRRRGHGVLINVASVAGRMGSPLQSAYCASKYAVRGFSESLRQELLDTGISVCTVMPSAVDTPLWDHTANYSGYELEPIPPVFPPERIARTIVACIEKPRAEITIGLGSKILGLVHDIAPAFSQRLMKRHVEATHFSTEPAERSNGNLFEPIKAGTGIRSKQLASKRRVRKLLFATSVPIMAVGLSRLAPRLYTR